MRKVILVLVIALLAMSCSTYRVVVDEGFFREELNSAIEDGWPESTYKVKYN